MPYRDSFEAQKSRCDALARELCDARRRVAELLGAERALVAKEREVLAAKALLVSLNEDDAVDARGRAAAKKRTASKLVAVVIGGVLVVEGLVPLATTDGMRVRGASVTRTNAQGLWHIAEMWRAIHDDACPKVSDLVEDGLVDRTAKLTDAWDRPFVITCRGDETWVRSVGRDGKEGSPDDVVAPAVASRSSE